MRQGEVLEGVVQAYAEALFVLQQHQFL